MWLVLLQFRSCVCARCFTCCKFFIADVSSSVFIEPLLLIDFVQKTLKIGVLNRKLTKPEHAKVCGFSYQDTKCIVQC